MREVLEKVQELLINLQPKIENNCYPGRAVFIDNYIDLALELIAKELAKEPTEAHPMQPVVMVGEVARFKANPIVVHLLDHSGIDMNELARVNFSREDRVHFAQLIGYSVSGFGSLSYSSDEVYDRASKAVEDLIAKKSESTS